MDKKEAKVHLNIFYLCVQKKAHERWAGKSKVIPKESFMRMLGETYHIPKKLRPVVMKEMENQKMIRILGTTRNNNVELLPLEFDPEEKANTFYRQLGMF